MINRTIALLSISALFLLSGCTQSETKACEVATQAAKDYINDAKIESEKLDTLYGGEITDKNRGEVTLLLQAINDLTLKSYKVVVNNQKCFSPQEVVEAQTNLGE